MSDYAVKITIRNARILRLMRSAGIESVAELSRRSGVRQQALGKIINLKKAPINQNGEWSAGVEDIAGVLQCDPEDMFSEVQRTLAIESNSREVEMDEPTVMALAAGGNAEDQTWAKIETQRLLGCLKERERHVIEAIANGAQLEEIGSEIGGVSVARVRQIEAKAMQKMKRMAVQSDKSVSSEIMAADVVRWTPNPDWKPRAEREREEAEKRREKNLEYRQAEIERRHRLMEEWRGKYASPWVTRNR